MCIEKPLAHNVVENRHCVCLPKRGILSPSWEYKRDDRPADDVNTFEAVSRGKVSEVHVWSNKKWGREEAIPASSNRVPDSLDWGLWLGVADERLYREDVFHPGQWRRLLDFGTGTLGDMGVHIFDTPI